MMMLLSPGSSPVVLVVVLLLLVQSLNVVVINAEKDSDYYYPGFTNPNTDNPMYWKDSINVLQDLDQFQSLYVRYHHCVWSKYGTRYGSGEDYDEQGADQDDNDDNDNGCGGWGGEYFWYMGRTQCFKANVAYSLYGILKSDSNVDSSKACSKKTYINSFFTTFGVESFAGPLGMGVDDVNSQCNIVDDGNNGEDGDEYEYAAADDDYLDDGYVFYNYAAYTSYGTGCTDEGKFVLDQYTGAFCHGKNYEETLDTLDDFNSAVEDIECTQIYDASNNNNNNGNRKLEEDDYNFDDMDAIDILKFSKSCSLRQYPNDCPDPYGLKKKYGKRIDRAFEYKTGKHRNTTLLFANVASYICLAGGIIFLLSAFFVHRNAANKKRRWCMWFGRNNNNDNKSVKSVSSKSSKISISKKNKKENTDNGTQPSIFEEIVSKTSTASNSVNMPWSSFGGNDNEKATSPSKNEEPKTPTRAQKKKMEVEMTAVERSPPSSPSSTKSKKSSTRSPRNFLRKKLSKKNVDK